MSLSTVLLVLVVVFFAVLAKIRLKLAVMVVLAALPVYMIRFSLSGVPLTLLEVMILVVFFVWLVQYTKLPEFIKGRYSWRDFMEARKCRRPYPFSAEVALAIIFAYAAAGAAGFTDPAMGIWKAYFFEPVLFFLVLLNLAAEFRNGDSNESAVQPDEKQNKFKIDWILWPLAVSVFLAAMIAIVEKLTGWFSAEGFWPLVTGPFGYPNALGLYLGPLVLVLFGWGMARIKNSKHQAPNSKQIPNFKSKIPKLFLFITILVSLIAVYLARSEGAFIGMVAGLLVFGVGALGLKFDKLKRLPVMLVSLIFLFVVLSPIVYLKIVPEHEYYDFGSPTANYIADKVMLKDLAGEIRKKQWRETWELLKKDHNWLWGIGLSRYQEEIAPLRAPGLYFNYERDPEFRTKIVIFDDRYRDERWVPVGEFLYPHNFVLNFWVELGFFGMLIFTWIVFKYFLLGFQIYFGEKKNPIKLFTLGLIGAMVVVLVHGLVDVPYFKNDLAVLFWVLAALMALQGSRFKQTVENEPHSKNIDA